MLLSKFNRNFKWKKKKKWWKENSIITCFACGNLQGFICGIMSSGCANISANKGLLRKDSVWKFFHGQLIKRPYVSREKYIWFTSKLLKVLPWITILFWMCAYENGEFSKYIYRCLNIHLFLSYTHTYINIALLCIEHLF